ncbi:MAG: hypothetical protein LBJ69_01735 [Holosporales bacterium]|jgi:hypothetical protein|nr:hypothetical protein [Holosporales bacterium]
MMLKAIAALMMITVVCKAGGGNRVLSGREQMRKAMDGAHQEFGQRKELPVPAGDYFTLPPDTARDVLGKATHIAQEVAITQNRLIVLVPHSGGSVERMNVANQLSRILNVVRESRLELRPGVLLTLTGLLILKSLGQARIPLLGGDAGQQPLNRENAMQYLTKRIQYLTKHIHDLENEAVPPGDSGSIAPTSSMAVLTTADDEMRRQKTPMGVLAYILGELAVAEATVTHAQYPEGIRTTSEYAALYRVAADNAGGAAVQAGLPGIGSLLPLVPQYVRELSRYVDMETRSAPGAHEQFAKADSIVWEHMLGLWLQSKPALTAYTPTVATPSQP